MQNLMLHVMLALGLTQFATVQVPTPHSTCNCETLVRSTMDCRLGDWNRHADAVVASRDELGILLENLIEGSEEGISCFLNFPFAQACGCPAYDVDTDSTGPAQTSAFSETYDCVEERAEP